MTSAAQKQANKQNAQHSTGPRTAEGKQRTARNAIKHGFRAKDPLIPGEDLDEFYRHSGELLLELGPIGVVEENLVDQLTDITWRLKRFSRIEAAIINELYDSAAEQPENAQKDGEQLLGNALADNHALNRLSRYEAQLARRYHNVMKELREVRKQRGRRLALSSLYAKQATQLQTNAVTTADHKPQANEPTQSAASHLESILQQAEATAYGCLETGPPPPPNSNPHPEYAENAGQPGNKEATA